MKRTIYFFTILCVVFLNSCQGINEPQIDAREKFVGAYSLNIASDVQIYDGKNYHAFDMSAKNKSIIIAIDPASANKFIISGYYGNTTATLQDGKLCMEETSITDYSNGVYLEIRLVHLGATINGNILTWETGVAIVAIDLSSSSTNTLSGTGILTNTATKYK